jgi:hypothetical protein
MMKVICVGNAGGYHRSLTIGRSYDILKGHFMDGNTGDLSSMNFIAIKDDYGYIASYDTMYFRSWEYIQNNPMNEKNITSIRREVLINNLLV